MEEVNSVSQWLGAPWVSTQTPNPSWHAFKVDIVNVSLMDELLAHPLYACVCFIHGISQDAFDP